MKDAIDLYEHLEASLLSVSAEDKTFLSNFLCLVSMCGAAAPSDLILDHLGIGKEGKDHFVEIIKRHLIDSEPPWLIELEHKIPSLDSLQKTPFCRFVDPIIKQAVLRRFSVEECEHLAREFLSYLPNKMPIYSKETAGIYVELANYAKQLGDIDIYKYLISWWAEGDFPGSFKEELLKSMQEKALAPEVIWKVFEIAKYAWHPHNLLVLLDAYFAQPGGVPPVSLCNFLYERSNLLLITGEYTKALSDTENALRLDNNEDAWIAALLGVKGLCEAQLARFEEAMQDLNSALDISGRIYGDEHVNLNASLANLAGLYIRLGRYAEAEPFIKHSLQICEKTLGPNHPDIVPSLNNLVDIYMDQGKYAEAYPLIKRSLTISVAALGPDHPDLANPINNLARLHIHEGEYFEAESLIKRSLEIFEKAMGPDHSNMAIYLNNLANVYIKQHKYAEAEPLIKRSIEMSEKALGPDHPNRATYLNNLAGLYIYQGKYVEAEPILKQSLEIYENVFGPDHPDVASVMEILADCYRAMGKYDEANKLSSNNNKI